MKSNQGQAPKTLVAEDSPPNRMILCHLLQKMGFDVYEAADGKEALGWLKENSPALILSDLMMPNMGGLELLENVRNDAKLSGVLFFIVTALGEEDSAREAEHLKCDGILLKPLSVQALQELLQPHFPELKSLRRSAA